MRTLRQFFGTDRVGFSALSAVSRTTRTFSRFSQAIREIVDPRVYSGIHFRTADEQGARIGRKVARWRQAHFFHPAEERGAGKAKGQGAGAAT